MTNRTYIRDRIGRFASNKFSGKVSARSRPKRKEQKEQARENVASVRDSRIAKERLQFRKEGFYTADKELQAKRRRKMNAALVAVKLKDIGIRATRSSYTSPNDRSAKVGKAARTLAKETSRRISARISPKAKLSPKKLKGLQPSLRKIDKVATRVLVKKLNKEAGRQIYSW